MTTMNRTLEVKMENDAYQRAESFLPWNLENKIFNATIFPYWTSDALYYFQQHRDGKTLIKVDLITGNKESVFDLQEIISALSVELNKEIISSSLLLDKFFVREKSLCLCFEFEKKNWSYDIESRTLVKQEEIKLNQLKSPDKKWSLWVENFNLVLTDLCSNINFNLTDDGNQYHDYASSPETNTRAITQRLEGHPISPIALWSSDSKKIVTHKLDQRKVKELFILQNAPKHSKRPEMHAYRMSFSGDTDLPLAELFIVDVETQKIIPIQTEALLSPYLTPLEFNWVWWSSDNKSIYFIRESRGAKKLELCVADANSGKTEILIMEEAETYVEPSMLAPWSHQSIILSNNKIIWLSQESGYPHLYLYDNKNKHQITNGEWYIREVHFYHDKSDWLYFTACGHDKKIDPYYKQLFRCRLNGSDLQNLTKENAHHFIQISKNQELFLDTYSTIDSAPISVLKKMDGDIVCQLETSDIIWLSKLSWIPPKRICFKGRDGKTDIYGNLYFPSNFDERKKYPIIDHVYPGSQVYRTTQYFNLYGNVFRSSWMAQALAELGFLVVHLDGLGTPGRSKHFHDATYGNMGDCGLPDHIAVIEQLSKQYHFIDLDRVGITGYSAGGYATVRAMLMYPDFFKVGVAGGGNHDLRCYPASYGEKYNGLDSSQYEYQSNTAHADKLKGNLLLVHGEMDDNVHPCATMQLVDALIKNNKDFEMLIMPNQNHANTFDHPYYIRKCWDYFVKNLLNETPPKDYFVHPIPDEFIQITDW